MKMEPQIIFVIILAGGMLLLLAAATKFSGSGSLNIKSKTVGDGQHGTARWATPKEISQTYARVQFKVEDWRNGKELPNVQGLILGSTGKKGKVTALVDQDDIHCLMIGASGIGKTAFFLYPNMGATRS
jgi:type IV secretion system protein VirD4